MNGAPQTPSPRPRQRGPQPKSVSPVWFIAAALGVAAMFLFLSSRLRTASDAEIEAQVRSAGKPPELRKGGKDPWKAAPDGTSLAIGDEVRTTEGMSSALAFETAASMRLFIYSVGRVEAFSREQGELVVRLLEGRAWMDADRAMRVKVLSPAGEVTVSDGAAEIRLERDRFEVWAWRGSVTCAGKPLVQGHRLVGETGKPAVERAMPQRADVWQAWNLRTDTSLLATGPPPDILATGKAMAAAPLASATRSPRRPVAVKASTAPSSRPVARRSSGPAAYPTALGAVSGRQTRGSAVSAGAGDGGQGQREEVTLSANDPIEKQIADAGTVDIMQHVALLSTDAALIARVDRVGRKIAQCSPRASLPWSFRVLETRKLNAMTVGYGRVYVTRGMLEIVDDEELAGVLGHEIAHACMRHLERSFDKKQEIMGYVRKAEDARRRAMALQDGTASGESQTLDALVSEYRENLRRALELLEQAQSPAERWEAEYQADRYGMLYAHDAGYRPVGLIDSLEKLRQASGGDLSVSAEVKAASSHPPLSERLEIARKVYQSFFAGRR